MEQFGEPLVETGGIGTLSPAFDFPTEERLIKSGFPFTRYIDGDGDAQAEDKMNNWESEMRTRFTTALNTLRAKTDNFSGISGVTI